MEELYTAIRGGNLPAIKDILGHRTPQHARNILQEVKPDFAVVIQRPGNKKDIRVFSPAPLTLAVCYRQAQILEYLLTLCADQALSSLTCSVDDLTNVPHRYDDVTALHLAVILGDFNSVQYLVQHGCNTNCRTSLGDTPLVEACFERHHRILDYLIHTGGGDVNQCNNRGVNPLMIAAFADHADVIKYLVSLKRPYKSSCQQSKSDVEAGVAPLINLSDDVQDAAHHTCVTTDQTQDENCSDEEKEEGDGGKDVQKGEEKKGGEENDSLLVDIHHVDKDGRNVLFYAAAGGQADTVVYLMQTGVPVTSDLHHVTIYMEAAFYRQRQLLEYMTRFHKELDLDLSAVDDTGRNALFYTTEHNAPDVFLYLVNTVKLQLTSTSDGRTLLMMAALKRNVPLASHLISHSCTLDLDINAKDSRKRNCLFYCVTSGCIELFDLLVEAKVPMERAVDGITLVIQAVAKNQYFLLDHMLTNYSGAPTISVFDEDNDGWNPLMFAVAAGNEQMVRLLSSHGAVSAAAHDGRAPLMQAAYRGDSSIITHLLDNSHQLDVYINQRDHDNWNALFYTISGGYTDVMQLLIRRGAHACIARDGRTLLHEAVSRGQTKMVDYLLENASLYNLDLQHKDATGADVLLLCSGVGDVAMFRRLVAAGCKLHPDNDGRNAVMIAAAAGHSGMVQYLVLHKHALQLHLHHKDARGCNVLFYCVSGRRCDLLEFLLRCDVPVEADERGRTLLMQAAELGTLDIVQYILMNENNLQLRADDTDKNGENGLFYAARSTNASVVELMLKSGAKIDQNDAGVNVLAQSMTDGYNNSTEAMIQHLLHGAANQPEIYKSINGHDASGRTVFHHCVLDDNLSVLHRVAPYYEAHAYSDVSGETCLMVACRHGRLECIKYLVETVKVNRHAWDHCNRDALYHAVQRSEMSAVEYLLQQHDVGTFPEDQSGVNVLMLAVWSRQGAIAEMLLATKHNRNLPNRTDKLGRTAAHYCVMGNEQADMVLGTSSTARLLDILQAYGADVNAADEEHGATPVMYACARSDVASLGALLKRRAVVDTLDYRGYTPLHHCLQATQPSLRCVRLLIKYGCDVNAVAQEEADIASDKQRSNNNNDLLTKNNNLSSEPDEQSATDVTKSMNSLTMDTWSRERPVETGITPLMLACMKCAVTNIPIVTCLLNAGADPFMLDREGRDCMELCPYEAQYVKGMMESLGDMAWYEQEALDMYTPNILEILQLKSALRGLIQEGVFTKSLQFEVMKQPSSDRLPKLLMLLRRRGSRAFRGFVQMLKGEMQYELAYNLMKTAYVKQDELYV